MAELKTIPLEKISIPDVRVSSVLNPEQRALLSSTIKEIGVVQNIVVRTIAPDAYELVAGKSRLEELQKLGVTETEVKVIGVDEKLGLIMNIVENVARGSFDYISIARSIRKLRGLGATAEELEKIFPWKRRWILFLEELQDLPQDVTEAIASRKITPTHVMLAANLPTPHEVHDGLKTAINLGWDTGTFKTFVQNRVEQLERAKREAAARGVEVEIPAAVPGNLIRYKQCLLCGYKKPAEKVMPSLVCDGCQELISYITGQLGPPEEALHTIYAALQAYYGQPLPRGAIPAGPGPAAPRPRDAVPTPPQPSLSAAELSMRTFQTLQHYHTGDISREIAYEQLLNMGFSAAEVDKKLGPPK